MYEKVGANVLLRALFAMFSSRRQIGPPPHGGPVRDRDPEPRGSSGPAQEAGPRPPVRRVARVIPQSVDTAQVFYLIGAIVLVIGALAAVTGTLIRRRVEEAQRDERYVRERRGEAIAPVEPPRISGLLLYAGVCLATIGILFLVAGWTVAPGQA